MEGGGGGPHREWGFHGIAEVLSSASPFKKRLGIPALDALMGRIGLRMA
jgi:hypothetical protein